MGRKLFNTIGIASIVGYGITVAGYFINKRELNLPLEIVYFLAICGTLLYIGFLLYLQSKKKEVRENTHLAVSAILFFAILVVIYMIGARHHRLFDVTADKKYSLSDQTIKVLGTLDEPIELLAFFRRGQEGSDEVERMFQQYVYRSNQVSYKIIDPQENPAFVEQYNVERFGELVIKAGEKIEKAKALSEEEITNTILKVTSDTRKRIAFVVGHDEPSIEDGEGSGYSLIKRHLELQNYQVDELFLFREEKVPADIHCLILASPKKELFPNEVELLKQYVAEGGSILFLLDPKIVPTLNQLLNDLGFDTKEAMIVDPVSRVFGGNAFTPVSMQYIPHPITEGFRVACFFPTVRMVDVKTDLPEGFTGMGIAYTAPGSWAEFDEASLQEKPKFDKGVDIQGPVSIVAVLEKNWIEEGQEEPEQPPARLVAVGDSNFIDNTSLGMSGNKDLFMNTISWLARDENLISIRKTQGDSQPLLLKKPQQVMVFTVPVIFMPLIALGTGILSVYRLRKES